MNKGHEFGYEKFTKTQINKLIKLCLNLKRKYNIKDSNIVGHSDIAPLRKQDPGEKFPWKQLKKKNLGFCRIFSRPLLTASCIKSEQELK